MKRRTVLLTTLVLLASSALADSSSRLRTLFPREAPVQAQRGGLVALELTPEVLAGCRADLSDLRLFDGAGREVPYWLDRGRPMGTREQLVKHWSRASLEVERGRQAREGLPPLLWEAHHLAVPPPEAGEGPWDLVLETGRRSFVRRVQVAVQEDGGPVVLKDASVFRLPDPSREKLRVPLPPIEADRVVVTLEGDDGSYLSPVFRFESRRRIGVLPPAPVELQEVGRRRDAGRTIVVLARPRGVIPEALQVVTSAPAFYRVVEVGDEGPASGPGKVGRGTVFRVPALTPVEELDIPIGPCRGDRLRVVVHDGGSPPLEGLSFRALVRRPEIVFALPPRTEPGEVSVLTFGGGRARPPQYDLEALPLRAPAAGIGAELGAWLRDPGGVPRATLGASRPNPLFDPAPALGFAMHAGAPVDIRLWTHRARIDLAPSAEGLVRVPLRPEDLAPARADLADLRVVDGDGRQWAYLLEPGGDGEDREIPLEGAVTRDRATRYPFRLPVVPATLDRVQLAIGAPFFDRAFQLEGQAPGEPLRVLASGRLARRDGETSDPVLSFPAARLEALALRVSDGDDAPLPLLRATARFPAPELFIAAPAGGYALLVGHSEAEAPRYEIAQARPLILAVASAVSVPGPLEPNPDYSAKARLAAGAGPERILLWVALGVAVPVLVLLTLRVARARD